jgi:hypothetical protein
MTKIWNEAKSGDALAKKINALDEESFLKNLNSFPYPFQVKAVQEKLKAVSRDWKKKIETRESREFVWEYTLYLVHLCPRLLDTPEFKWLKERFYAILMMRLWSSGADRDYWEALKRVRKDFTVTKPKTPEKKWIVARKYEDHRSAWIKEEISGTCNYLLGILRSERVDRYEKINELSRRIKVSSIVVEVEIKRLCRVYEEEIRGKGDLIMLPNILRNDLNLEEEPGVREEGEKFWQKIWLPSSRKMGRLRRSFIEEVSKETGLSGERVRKLLGQGRKEGAGFLSL